MVYNAVALGLISVFKAHLPDHLLRKPMQSSHVAITRTLPLSAEESPQQLVDRVLNDAEHPLVMFAREGCEFCWAARKFFDAIESPYRIIELDSEEFRRDGLNQKIRNHLQSGNGSTTVPQIYVAGRFVGGATDSFDAWKSGEFQKWLQTAGVNFKQEDKLDTSSFISGWLHAF